MADVITIGGVDRSGVVDWDSLKIEQTAGQYTAVCSLRLNDTTPAIAIGAKDTITVVDNVAVETLFAGEVADVDWDLLSLGLDGRRIPLACQDYGILVEEAVIDTEEAYSAEADSDIIDDLFTTYRADINSVAHVSTIDASMDLTVQNVTLRQAMDEICKLTGGYWYVDESKNLHYFAAEANVAAWFLSDSPDNINSFNYQNIKRQVKGGTLVNQILVVGSNDVAEWREDAASVAAYGERPAVVVDTAITSAGEAQDRGDAILARWSEPRVTYQVTTRKSGLRAGMDVRIVCGAWAVDETLTVRRLTIRWQGDERFYDLELGDVFVTAPGGGNTFTDRINKVEIDTGDLNDTVYDDDAPGAPAFNAGNLSTGTVINNDGSELVYIVTTWGAVGDSDLSHYEVQLSTANDFSANVLTRHHPGDGQRIERWEGLTGNVTYYCRVRAVDWALNASAWVAANIASAVDASAPNQVANLVVAGARSIMGLDWDDNSEADLSHYEIQRDDDAAGSPSGAWATIATARVSHWIDETFSEADIQAETVYHYRVRAVDTSGNDGNWSASDSDNLDPFGSDSIAALSIIAGKVAANAIDTINLTAGCVETDKLDSGAVTAEKMTVTVGGYNVLMNSGMNDDDDGDDVPDEWTEEASASNFTTTVDAASKVVGASSLKIVEAAGDANGEYVLYYQIVTLADVPLAVGDDFVLSGYLTTSGLSDVVVVIRVRWYDAGVGLLQTDDAATVTGDVGWGRYTVTNTVPAGAVTARVRLFLQLTANNGTGTAQFDAIKLERGDIPTAWTTGLIGHVTIDSNRVQVQDANAKVWIGKRGSSLGMWGEDAAGNLEVGWYASGANAGYVVFAAGNGLLGSTGISIEATNAYVDARSYRFTYSGATISKLEAKYLAATVNYLQLVVEEETGLQSVIDIQAFAATDKAGTINLDAYGDSEDQVASIILTGHQTAQTSSYVGIAPRLFCDEIYCNDSANANLTIGITINQASNDDELLAFKSADVAHGITDVVETDTYADFMKSAAASGGLNIRGFTEDEIGIELQGWATNDDTNKDGTADAYVVVNAYKKSGTTHQNPGADANLFAVQKRGVSVWIVDEDGDTYRDGTDNTFDAWDDCQLARAFDMEMAPAQVIRSEFDEFLRYDRQVLLDAGILSDPKGGNFYNESQLIRLHNGAIWQLYQRCQRYERALLDLGVEPALLEAR